MELKTQELMDLLNFASDFGADLEQKRAEAHELAVEASGLREELRSVKYERGQLKAKAATLEAMLDEEREKAKKNDSLFARMAQYNGNLHRMLQKAGIEAPSFADYLDVLGVNEEEGEGEE